MALPAEGVGELPLAEPYTQHLTGLEVGEHAGPFEVGDRTIWVKIMAIEQPPGRSIYDPQVQRMLRSQLESRRENEEMIKYRLRLLQDGSVDDIDTMAERLLEIALRRYAVSMS